MVGCNVAASLFPHGRGYSTGFAGIGSCRCAQRVEAAIESIGVAEQPSGALHPCACARVGLRTRQLPLWTASAYR